MSLFSRQLRSKSPIRHIFTTNKISVSGAGWVSTSIDLHFINFHNNLDALSHKRSF